jgi:pyruvate/oxaloacetate carboxyltransferase
MAAMTRRILIRDLTLRDGQQSQFATRMTQAQVDRVLPHYQSAGFYALEVWGGAVPDSVMRYLGENPWHRLERIKEAMGVEDGISSATPPIRIPSSAVSAGTPSIRASISCASSMH